MSARRRSLFLAITFLAFAVLLTTNPARAQSRKQPKSAPTQMSSAGQHQIDPNWKISPDQFRMALGISGAPLDPQTMEALRENMKMKFPDMDEKGREALLQLVINSPEFQKKLKDAEKQWKADKQPGTKPGPPPDFGKMLKDFPPLGLDKNGNPMPPPIGRPTPPKGNSNPQIDLPSPPKLPKPPAGNPDGKSTTPPITPMGKIDPPPIAPRPMTPPDDPLGGDSKLLPPAVPPAEKPEDLAKRQALQALGATWERNVGPLDDTPAVKSALEELAQGAGDLKGPDGKSFWEEMMKDTDGGVSIADWFDGANGGSDFKWPSFDLPSLNFGGGSGPDVGGSRSSSSSSWWSRRSSSKPGGSSGSPFGFSIPGMEGSWLPLVILAVLLIGALVVWRFWYLRDAKSVPVYELGGLGPWPVDPRRIATREDLVLAFEYLSVLICGPSAKMWTHTTIAQALAELATTHAETAMILARLYELARYAPLDEPLTTAEIAEARRLVCRLAGVSYE